MKRLDSALRFLWIENDVSSHILWITDGNCCSWSLSGNVGYKAERGGDNFRAKMD